MNENDAKGRFVSECIDLFIDEPGDHTVRSIRSERLEQMKALCDQILAAEAEEKERDPIASQGAGIRFGKPI